MQIFVLNCCSDEISSTDNLLTWWSSYPNIQQLSAILDLEIFAIENTVDAERSNGTDLIFSITLLKASRATREGKVYTIKLYKEGENN